jgi:hypothetical protein
MVRTVGAAVLILAGLLYVTTREHAPIVHVRWSASVDPQQRASLLRRYDLARCTPFGERTDSCELLDTSRSNIAAIAGDSRIEDTYHINRAGLTITPDADRAIHVTWIAHRTPLGRVPYAIEIVLLIACALVVARPVSVNAALGLVALAIFFVMALRTGRIDVNDGLGYDGLDYASMVREGLGAGTEFTRLRPLVIVLAWIPYYFTQDVVRSFWILNSIFVFLQAYVIARLADLYGIDKVAKIYLVVSLALCIATAKMFAYYPVLIDLGGCVAIMAAVYAILALPRPVAAVAVCLAVLARELTIGAALFGLHRDIRRGAGVSRAAITYLPALAIAAIVRRASTGGQPGAGLFTRLAGNIERFWTDPLFISLLLYFVLTTFGGISLMLFARSRPAIRLLREEPEWVSFALPVVVIASSWSVDMWRFLVYLLPLVIVLFARSSREWTLREQGWLYAIGAVATWYTQQPLQHLDLRAYFRDWFPYFHYVRDIYVRDIPADPSDLWPVWTRRFIVVLLLLAALSLTSLVRRGRTLQRREVAPPSPI